MKVRSIDWKNKTVTKECSKIKILKYAQVDAAACIPKDNETSQTELEIQALADEHLNKIKNIGLTFFGKLEPEINAIKNKIFGAKMSFALILEKYKTSISQLINQTNIVIEEQKNSFTSLKDDFDLFKAQNFIARPAAPANLLKFIIFIGIIAILFVLEVRVNSEIAGQAFAGGRAEGETISRAVAGLNVFLSFLIGFYAVKQMFHSHSGNKMVGKIILFLYIPFVTYINFSFGALRALASTYSSDSSDDEDIDDFSNDASIENAGSNNELGSMFENIPKTFEEMKSLSLMPWDGRIPWDYESFVLVAIGLAFGLFSILDGYLFDDKYPGYGSAARKKENAKKKLLQSYSKLNKQVDNLSNKFFKDLENNKTELNDEVEIWSKKTNEFQNEIEAYKVSLESGRTAYDHMMRQYMKSNRRSRPNKCKDVPERYIIAEDLDIPCFQYDANLSDPKIVFSQHYDVYEKDDKRTSLANEYHDTVNSAYMDAQKEMKKLADEKAKQLKSEHENLKNIF